MGTRGARELRVLQVPQLPLPDPQKVPLTLGFNRTFSNTDHGRSSNETFFCIKQKSLLIFFFQYLLVVNRRGKLVHFTNPASPCPAAQSLFCAPLLFKAAGRDAGSSSSIALLCSWGAHPASHLLPNSLPLIAGAGAEMLVLITVGNTNQRGTFC